MFTIVRCTNDRADKKKCEIVQRSVFLSSIYHLMLKEFKKHKGLTIT